MKTKKFKHSLLSQFLLISICFAMLFVLSANAVEQEGKGFSKLKLLFTLQVGIDISYTDNPECALEGPVSYCVSDNGEVYVISGEDTTIIRMSDKKTMHMEPGIPVSFCACYDDIIYVLTYSKEIFLYDIEEGLIGKYPLPDNLLTTDLRNLKADAQGLHLLTIAEKDNYIYDFDKKSFEKIKVSEYKYSENPTPYLHNPNETITVFAYGKEVTINLQNKITSYLGYDETGIYLKETEYIPGNKSNKTEKAVRKYDFDGKLVEYAILDYSGCVVFPLRTILLQNGKLYFFKGTYETIEVYTITLGNADVSHLYDDKSYANTYNSGFPKLLATEETTLDEYTSFTRDEILARAYVMANLHWKVNSWNKVVVTSPHPTTLPGYISTAPVNTYVDGIPYCWGGFNGYDSKPGGEAFSYLAPIQMYGLMTGNVYTSNSWNHVTGTIGLDCSGFLSSAYGQSLKGSTYHPEKYGDVIITRNQFQPGDALIDSTGPHRHCVLLFNEDDGIYDIYESTTHQSYDKVIFRTVDNDYITDEFILYKPIHDVRYDYNDTQHWQYCNNCGRIITGTTQNHSTTTGYDYDNTYHFKICETCGATFDKETHTSGIYIYNTTQHWKECTVCGKITVAAQNHTPSGSYFHNSSGHYKRCSVCHGNCTLYPHVWTTTPNYRICNICGRKEIVYVADNIG